MIRRALLLALPALLLATSLPLLAQEENPAKPDNAPLLGPDELAARQRAVGERIKKLEDIMTRIAERLATTDPDKAARLRLAWQRSRDDRNLEIIQEIENLLRVEEFTEAFEQQKRLEVALERLLDILLDRDADRKDIEEKIEKYERMAETVERLIEQERGHQLKTEKFADPEKTLQRAAAARAKLADLIERQQKLNDKTGQADAGAGDKELGALADRLRDLQNKQRAQRGQGDPGKQAELAKQADQLAKDLQDLADKQPDEIKQGSMGQANPAQQAADAMKRAAQGMSKAAQGMTQPQDGGGFEKNQKEAEQDLREAAEALQRLDARKRKLGEKELAKQQERIKRDAERLREELERLEKSAPGNDSGSGDLSKAQDRMGRAQKSLEKGANKQAQPQQKEAKADLERAYEKLKEFEKELKRLTQLPEYDKLAKDQDKTTEDTESLLKKMKEQGGNPPPNQDPQDGAQDNPGQNGVEQAKKAKADLERAYEKLKEFEKELKRLTQLPEYDKLAKDQDKTTEDTESLLKKMKEQGGNPPPNQDPQDGAQDNPGQNGVEQAKKAMQRASKNLRQKSAKRANSDQKEAIERLEKARDELEEALRQLREEEQLMLLDAIERRLVRMLEQQNRIYKETISLSLRLGDAAKAKRKPARADVDKGHQLGDGQAELAAEAEKLIEILREEGTTVVIPDVIEDLKADLDNLAARLRRMDAGSYTQEIQRDVITTLRELIQVVQEELDRRQGGQQGQGGQDPMEGGQEDNLLPTSAELKMLKSLQVRVNRRTHEFERMKVQEDDERGRIADKQAAASRLTRTMADKLNREEE